MLMTEPFGWRALPVDTVQLLVDVLGPVVVIVAIGALVAPRLGLDTTTLSKLAYWILGPAFVFNIFSTTTLEADTAAKLVTAGAASVVAAAIAGAALSPMFGLRGSAMSATVMSSAYGNVGNAGLAICVFALGEDAIDRAGVLMVTIMFFGTLLSVWLGTRQTQSGLKAAFDALVSPMIAAAMVGFLFNLVNLDTPTVIDRAVSTIAQGLIPVMLVTLGLQLATSGSLRLLRSTGVVTIAKLVVAPIIGWAVAEAFGLTGDDRGVIILQAAMPPAVFCMVLALEHDLEADRTTNDVVVVTIASLLTLPLALTLVA
ncbi:MAG: putative permease [Acidimicrobiales bacterium]|jgi:predicted permease